ncbi:unnamed protein product, partial [Enterobius vermicularis]|uniref:C-type lectin domain-containing protein n=1 Tax=Enterobius vermicularis TaxID=51028 RepID=A0A0N4UTX8_ENTVE
FDNSCLSEWAVNSVHRDSSVSYLWNERGEWEKHYNHNQTALHPVKLSSCKNATERFKFCKYVIGTFKKYLLS